MYCQLNFLNTLFSLKIKENIENLAGNVATAGTENKQSLDAISSNIATAAINIDTLATNVATAGAENKISLDSLSGKT